MSLLGTGHTPQAGTSAEAEALIAEARARTRRRHRRIAVAVLATSYAANRSDPAPVALSCSSMALDPSGRFLLVPYLVTSLHPSDEYAAGSLTAARINIATGARSDWTLRYGERESPGVMSIAW